MAMAGLNTTGVGADDPSGLGYSSEVGGIPTGGTAGAKDQQQGNIVAQLIQLLNGKAQQAQTAVRPQVRLPQQLPPNLRGPFQSGNRVNPSTYGGPARNARVGIGEGIVNLITNAENQHEMKKARDLAYDMDRIQTALENPTEANKALVNEILNDPKKRKDIGKALNIQFMGDDNRTNVQKMAAAIFKKGTNQQAQQTQQQGQQQAQQPGKTYADQLQRMMPQVLQVLPEVMLQAELVKAGVAPNQREVYEVFREAMKDSSAMQRLQLRLDEEIQKGQEANASKEAVAAGQIAGRYKVATVNLQGQLARAGATVQAAKTKADAERYVVDTIKKPEVDIKQQAADAKDTANRIKAASDEVNNASKILASKNTSSKDKQSAREKLDAATKTLDDLSKNIDNATSGTGTSTGISPDAQAIIDRLSKGGFFADDDEDEE